MPVPVLLPVPGPSSVSRETLNRPRLKYRLYVNYFISTSKAECIYMSQIIENDYRIPRCAAQLVPRGCRCGECGHSLTVPPRPLPRRGGTDRSGLGRTPSHPPLHSAVLPLNKPTLETKCSNLLSDHFLSYIWLSWKNLQLASLKPSQFYWKNSYKLKLLPCRQCLPALLRGFSLVC